MAGRVDDSEYLTEVTLARNKYAMYKGFRENPVIDKILSLGGVAGAGRKPTRGAYEKVADEIFEDVDYIREAKRVLDPNQFDMLRTTQLQKLIWKNSDHPIAESGAVEHIRSEGLLSDINKQHGGLDGPYWKELFSDALGNPLEHRSGGPEVLEEFKELTRLVAVADVQSSRLAPTSEVFSSVMAERVALGSVVANPAASLARVRTLIASLFANKRMAKHYLNQDENKFLQESGGLMDALKRGGGRQNLQAAASGQLTERIMGRP